ncbi:MAG: hypothetical protein A2X94_08590 [Bdellovibrionales bacterium GWB1_55_8]|nr:MAG: hypothetical protein A2X94_08590 [Bdellovibrionales bacterium GWB1_55_8]
MKPQKRALIESIVAELNRELETLLASAKAAHDAATHEESRAEDQHDTRGLEASYLAGAQMARAEALRRTIAVYQFADFQDFLAGDPIGVGALVELELESRRLWCFIVGQGGGMSVSAGDKAVQVITPQSPLGEELIGRRAGELFELNNQRVLREYEIISVS